MVLNWPEPLSPSILFSIILQNIFLLPALLLIDEVIAPKKTALLGFKFL